MISKLEYDNDITTDIYDEYIKKLQDYACFKKEEIVLYR